MTVTGVMRGHPVAWDTEAEIWRWSDNGQPAAQGWGGTERPCQRCGLTADPEDGRGGVDPCIGFVEGVTSACCGHGVEPGWIGDKRLVVVWGC